MYVWYGVLICPSRYQFVVAIQLKQRIYCSILYPSMRKYKNEKAAVVSYTLIIAMLYGIILYHNVIDTKDTFVFYFLRFGSLTH